MSIKNLDTYPNQRALANAKCLSLKTIRLAKENNAPGFKAAGRINWAELKPWLDANTDLLSKIIDKPKSSDDIDELRKRKLRGEADKVGLEVEKLRDNLLNKEDVKDFLRAIAAAQSAILKDKLITELPIKLVGKNQDEISLLLQEVCNELMKLFKDIKTNVD